MPTNSRSRHAAVLYLPSIPNELRKSEEEYWADFASCHPFILGTLLHGISAILRNAPRMSVEKENRSRLIDALKWAEAGCRALGFEEGAYLSAYQGNRKTAGEAAIEDNPVAQTVLRMLENTNEFFGRSSELLQRLNVLANPQFKESQKWPTNGAILSTKLRLAARLLRDAGVDIQFDQPIDRKDKRGIRIRKSRRQHADAPTA